MRCQAPMKGFDGVGTGEEQPMEVRQVRERMVEGGVACRLGELDGGDHDRLSTQRAQAVGQPGGLVRRPGDEDARRAAGGHAGDCRRQARAKGAQAVTNYGLAACRAGRALRRAAQSCSVLFA